jgi:hypothetical protein
VDEERSLEGWQAQPGAELPLGRIIDLAFDYRGNTTVVTLDGRTLEGYLFNRNADVAEPFIEMFDADGRGPLRIPYAEIRTIHFTGKDTAAGSSYAAWQRRREQEPGGDPASGRAHDDHPAR